MIKHSLIAIALGLTAALAMPALAQEHPAKAGGEHPAKASDQKKDGEHPKEHPNKGAAGGEVTTADISAGIKKHIDAESKKDGKFHVNYDGKDLAMTLEKVHDDRLSSLGDGKHFACVDMKATDGTVYDLDFFLTGKPGDMKVTDTSVHKVSGKALYDWKEEGGIWKKVAKS
ncbi:MAG: hypothetical protein ABR526_02455 [Chthoniobacterales bacterium]